MVCLLFSKKCNDFLVKMMGFFTWGKSKEMCFSLSLSRTVLAFRGNEMISLLARSRSQVVRQMTYPREVIISTQHRARSKMHTVQGGPCDFGQILLRGVLGTWIWRIFNVLNVLLMFYRNFINKFFKKIKINPFPLGHVCISEGVPTVKNLSLHQGLSRLSWNTDVALSRLSWHVKTLGRELGRDDCQYLLGPSRLSRLSSKTVLTGVYLVKTFSTCWLPHAKF